MVRKLLFPFLLLAAPACDRVLGLDELGFADTDSEGGDTDGDTDGDADSDADADADTDTYADCEEADDFTPCEVVTEPDRSFDICVNGVCVSPGCGDESCNTPYPHFPLPDTNQRLCYGDSAEMTCPSFGESYCGQDAQYGWDLTHEGSERFTRDLTVEDRPTVVDDVTGLTWQGCTSGLGGNNCQSGTSPVAGTWEMALAYCDALSWGGYADWRLPDPYELATLMDRGKGTDPFIDETAFPETQPALYWASSSRAALLSDAWAVSFTIGHVGHFDKTESAYALCVRGGPMEHRDLDVEVVDGDRIVLDTLTGLTWQGCASGLEGDTCNTGITATSNWQEALSYCEELNWGGYPDWRLPSIVELQSIASYRKSPKAFDSSAFPETPMSGFWSSSSFAAYAYYAWYLDFSKGYVGSYDKTNVRYVRCVRGEPLN